MTSTYIEGGKDSFEEVLRKAGNNALYIAGASHGTGGSTFTIAPKRAYRIKDGKLSEPLKVALISGSGKRKGTVEARMPTKILWIRRQRTLRRLLKKYREAKKIDKHLYHELYLGCKASQYKSKKNLIDTVEKILYKKNT
jgi:hypothetical protein